MSAPITPLNFTDTPTQITNVIHISDIHIKRLQLSHKPYQQNITYDIRVEYTYIFNKLIEALSRHPAVIARTALIVIVGDLLHEKGDVDPIANDLLNHLLGDLEKVLPTIIINGNHDYKQNMGNDISYLESQSTLIGGNLVFLKKSGLYTCANVAIGLLDISDAISPTATRSSVMNEHIPKVLPRDLPTHIDTKIALYHGGVYFDNNDQLSYGINSQSSLKASEYFGEYDIGMFGDIHLQMLSNVTPISTPSSDSHSRLYSYESPAYAYSGSLIQQNFGETIDGHGFLDWNIKDKQVVAHNIPNQFSKITIDAIEEVTINDSNNIYISNKQFGRILISEFRAKYPHITNPCIRMTTHISDLVQKHIFNTLSPSQIQIKPSTVDTRSIDSKPAPQSRPQLALSLTSTSATDTTYSDIDHIRDVVTNSESTMQIIINNLRANPNAAELLTRFDWTAFLSGNYQSLALTSPTINTPHFSYESALQSISTEIIKRNADINKLIESARLAGDNPLANAATIQELKIERLEWSYLFSYGRDCYIDFADFSKNIILINGANDAGKSSIFNILVLALYGETPVKYNKKELMPEAINTSCPRNERANSAIYFSINYRAADSTPMSKRYLIRTEYAYKNGPPKSVTKSTIMYQYSPAKMGYETFINNGNTKSIDSWVESNIGTKENFIMYYIYTQDLDYDFCKIPNELKQKTLARLFNPPNLQYIINLIDESQKAYRHVSKYVKQTIAALRSQIANTPDTLSTADITQLRAATTDQHATATQQVSQLTKLATVVNTLCPTQAFSNASYPPNYTLQEAEELGTNLATQCARITQLEAAMGSLTNSTYQFPAAITQLLLANSSSLSALQSAPESAVYDVTQLSLNLSNSISELADHNKHLKYISSDLYIDITTKSLSDISDSINKDIATRTESLNRITTSEYYDNLLINLPLNEFMKYETKFKQDSAHIWPQILLKLTPANFNEQYSAATCRIEQINSALLDRRNLINTTSAQLQTISDKIREHNQLNSIIGGIQQVNTVIESINILLDTPQINTILDCYRTRDTDSVSLKVAELYLVALDEIINKIKINLAATTSTFTANISQSSRFNKRLISTDILRRTISATYNGETILLRLEDSGETLLYDNVILTTSPAEILNTTTQIAASDRSIEELEAQLSAAQQALTDEHTWLLANHDPALISVYTDTIEPKMYNAPMITYITQIAATSINSTTSINTIATLHDEILHGVVELYNISINNWIKVAQRMNESELSLIDLKTSTNIIAYCADLQTILDTFVDGYGAPIKTMDDFERFEAEIAKLGTQLNNIESDEDTQLNEQILARIEQCALCLDKLEYYKSEELRILTNAECVAGLKFSDDKCECCRANRELIISANYADSLAQIRAGIACTQKELAAAELSPRDREIAAEYKRAQLIHENYSRNFALYQSHKSADIVSYLELAPILDTIINIYNARDEFTTNSAVIIPAVIAAAKWRNYNARVLDFNDRIKPELIEQIEVCEKFEEYVAAYNGYMGQLIVNEASTAGFHLFDPSNTLLDAVQLFVDPTYESNERTTNTKDACFNEQYQQILSDIDNLKLRQSLYNKNMILISEYNYVLKADSGYIPAATTPSEDIDTDIKDYLTDVLARYSQYERDMVKQKEYVADETTLIQQRDNIQREISELEQQLAVYDLRDLSIHRTTYQKINLRSQHRGGVYMIELYTQILNTLDTINDNLIQLHHAIAAQKSRGGYLDKLRATRDILAAELTHYTRAELAAYETKVVALKEEGDRLTSLLERSRNNEVITVTNTQKVANLEELARYSDNFDKFGADIESMYKIIKDLSSQNIRYFAGLISNIINSLFSLYQHNNDRTYRVNIDVTDAAASIDIYCDDIFIPHWNIGGFYKELLGFCTKIAFMCTSTNAVCRSRTLFADEPFAGGSDESIANIQLFLKQIMEAGYLDTIVMASHSALRDARTKMINLGNDNSGRTLVQYPPGSTTPAAVSHKLFPADSPAINAPNTDTTPAADRNDNFALATTAATIAGDSVPIISAAPKSGIEHITIKGVRISNLNHYNTANKQCCSALTKSAGSLCGKPATNPKNIYSLCAVHFGELNKP